MRIICRRAFAESLWWSGRSWLSETKLLIARPCSAARRCFRCI